ncbi:hypothetical protein B0A55_00125 [Friedmanniomyces simplex]|uniref:Uncharacterized protein n=1 Tax=Friedmanniomyces simplex TaxID=329884 RepID=A0A4U0Y5K2_9PEZI|nr:hypothetical protein B0A55_00125 [Friedmanniomyces simplex]
MAQDTATVSPALLKPAATTPSAVDPSTTVKQKHRLWHARHIPTEDTSTDLATDNSKSIGTGPLLHRRSSITERIIDLLPHHGGHKHPSLSDSGPIVVQEDPSTGHHLAHVNPHWPEDDSWRRQKERDSSGEDPVVAPAGVGAVSSY